MRALLLAASLDGSTTNAQFWRLYRDTTDALDGFRVHDPFMGGGSTLVEASRLGATVSGSDVDPTAVAVVSHMLRPTDADAITEAGRQLMTYLREKFLYLYPAQNGEPLHYFHVPIVECPTCQHEGALYRSLILARDADKPGAVVRDSGAVAFDPATFEVFDLRSATQKSFQGTHRRWDVSHATFKRFRYHCPNCASASTHRELSTGTAPTRLVAIERTHESGHRTIDAPARRDIRAINDAAERLAERDVPIKIPSVEFDESRTDPRPRSYGITHVADLFTDRQLLVLGAAHAWVESADLEPAVASGLKLALSNSLATNNRLCSYAQDYGRLSALFSVRGYSLPALSVELNPLHSKAGRGSIPSCIARVAASASEQVRRSYWDLNSNKPVAHDFQFAPTGREFSVKCVSASEDELTTPIDLLIFDPPYYDYIVYDELAELFRAWNPDLRLGGVPLQSAVSEEKAQDRFGSRFAECLAPALSARNPARPLAFTYHSSNESAWKAIGTALDEAKLRITALWPIRSDSHMGHHSHPGNCEWDVIVVCRPIDETDSARLPEPSRLWQEHTGDFELSDADLHSFSYAQSIAESRFGRVQGSSSEREPS